MKNKREMYSIMNSLPMYGYRQTLPRPYQEKICWLKDNFLFNLPIEQPINERKNSIGRSHSSRSSSLFVEILF